MTFFLGAKSRAELHGVHPRLVVVVERAIQITPVDFGVHDGLRTLEHQRRLFNSGASKTMSSKHLPQPPDGYGHAVDLVPYIGGQLRWEWPPIYSIAAAVRQAAQELDVRLVWGGVWDRVLNELRGPLKPHVEEYCARHPGPDFIDGPHYQLA